MASVVKRTWSAPPFQTASSSLGSPTKELNPFSDVNEFKVHRVNPTNINFGSPKDSFLTYAVILECDCTLEHLTPEDILEALEPLEIKDELLWVGKPLTSDRHFCMSFRDVTTKIYLLYLKKFQLDTVKINATAYFASPKNEHIIIRLNGITPELEDEELFEKSPLKHYGKILASVQIRCSKPYRHVYTSTRLLLFQFQRDSVPNWNYDARWIADTWGPFIAIDGFARIGIRLYGKKPSCPKCLGQEHLGLPCLQFVRIAPEW